MAKKKKRRKKIRKTPGKTKKDLQVRINHMLAQTPIKDLSSIRQRMQDLYLANKDQLQELLENPFTPVADLIIIRMLYNLMDDARLEDYAFYLDVAFGKMRAFDGAGLSGEDDETDEAIPVQFVRLPANGSEADS